MNQIYRVGLADHRPILRHILRRVLDDLPNVRIVGEAANRAELFQLVEQEEPELVIIDLALTPEEGIDIVQLLRRQAPTAKILLVTAHAHQEFFRAAYQAGAHGCFLSEMSILELQRAIQIILGGERYLPMAFSALDPSDEAPAPDRRDLH